RNTMGLDGDTEEVMAVEPIGEKFRACGWRVSEIDGHDPRAVIETLTAVGQAGGDRPHCVVARTVKGKGVAYMERARTWHLGYLAPPDAEATLKEIEAR